LFPKSFKIIDVKPNGWESNDRLPYTYRSIVGRAAKVYAWQIFELQTFHATASGRLLGDFLRPWLALKQFRAQICGSPESSLSRVLSVIMLPGSQ